MLCLSFLLLRAVIKMGACNSKLSRAQLQKQLEDAKQRILELEAINHWYNRIVFTNPIPAPDKINPLTLTAAIHAYQKKTVAESSL